MTRVLLPFSVLALIACQASPPRTVTAQKSGAVIQDQVHDSGTVGFYFLPPMVAQPSLDGAFDAALDATITISDPSGGVIAQFSTAAGSVSVSDHYQADWHTRSYSLTDGVPYRITVSSGGKSVGLADVLLFPNLGKAKNLTTSDDIALVDGQTLPIKFWMNNCAPVVCGACEVANSCSPATGACAPKAQGTVCRASTGICDATEVCDGVSGACPADAPAAAGTECRAAAGVCDAAEVCDGTSFACPDDAKLATSTVCRAAAGVCDAAETCDGVSNDCPADAKLPSTTVCGTAAGECDVAATCDGLGDSCPANHAAAAGTACSSDGNYCTADICDGSGISCTHPEAAGVCARDWVQYPSVAEVDTTATEMFVMSDIHGDYWAYTNLLFQEGVITAIPTAPVLPNVQFGPCTPGDSDCDAAHGALGIWKAGNAVMVIVGDLINKGPDSVDVIRLTMSLQQQAAAAGGHVVATLGNHEAEFLGDQGNSTSKAFAGMTGTYDPQNHGMDPELQALFNGNWLSYVFNDGDADGDDANLAGPQFTPVLTASGMNDIGGWIHALPFAARVNDWFFVHGGNTHGMSIDQIKLDVQSKLDSRGWTGKDGALTTDATSTLYTSSLCYDPSNVGSNPPFLSAQGSMLEARLQKSPAKVQWWDPVVTATGCTASGNASSTLASYTGALGVNHIVMGHQPALLVYLDGTTSRLADTINRYPNANTVANCPNQGIVQSQIFFVDMGMSQGNDSTGGGLLHITGVASRGGDTSTEAWQRWVPSIPANHYGTGKPATTTTGSKTGF